MTRTSDTCLLQFGCFAYKELIDKVYLHHARKCFERGYDYRAETELVLGKRPSWEKVRMIRDALNDGYKHIIWLDADAIWLRLCLLEPVLSVKHFGMCWHTDAQYGDHFNCGAIYINNTPTVRYVVDEWYNEPDSEHVWQDQWGLICVLKRLQVSPITIISNQWNSVIHRPDLSHEYPAVVAWHGTPSLAFSELPKYVQSLS